MLFEQWLPQKVLPALGRQRLPITIDEFEALGQTITRGRVEEAVLDEIRSLIQHESRLAFLFAGVATLDELGPRWSNYFINARALRITYLRPEEAEAPFAIPTRRPVST